VIFQSPPLGFEEDAALSKIEALKDELRYYVAEPRRWVGSVRRVLDARAIQGSNSIEGINVSVEDALAALGGDEPTDATLPEWHATQGYRRALTYVLQLAQDEHFQYTPDLIRSLHFMMTEYSLEASPGLWRPGPIWVRNDATGQIVYTAPDEQDVRRLVAELVDRSERARGLDRDRGDRRDLDRHVAHTARLERALDERPVRGHIGSRRPGGGRDGLVGERKRSIGHRAASCRSHQGLAARPDGT
jgi:hypothetical protein